MPAAFDSPSLVPVALCLGGMDPSAGAGLLRDVLTLASLGVHPMAISTAETLQNGLACLEIARPALSPILRLESLRPHLCGLWGVKLGLCALPVEELSLLMTRLDELDPPFCIWDPIQAPTSGVPLHDALALRRMARTVLGSGNWVVAPNRPEAAAFGDLPPGADPCLLAQAFLDSGAQAVWLKGGHAQGEEVEDFWIEAGGARSLGVHPRLAGERRGTGCAVASAWLGFRLQGREGFSAAQDASAWLRDHWDRAFAPGGAGRPVLAPEPA